jgi:hypothetical protein
VHANTLSQPHALVMLWAQVPMGMANGCGSMLSGCERSIELYSGAAWELCFSSGTCGWLTRLLLSGGLWCWLLSGALEQGRKSLWSLVRMSPRLGSAVQQAVPKGSTSFWSALYDFARNDRSVPA